MATRSVKKEKRNQQAEIDKREAAIRSLKKELQETRGALGNCMAGQAKQAEALCSFQEESQAELNKKDEKIRTLEEELQVSRERSRETREELGKVQAELDEKDEIICLLSEDLRAEELKKTREELEKVQEELRELRENTVVNADAEAADTEKEKRAEQAEQTEQADYFANKEKEQARAVDEEEGEKTDGSSNHQTT